jgi:hypothetical protein
MCCAAQSIKGEFEMKKAKTDDRLSALIKLLQKTGFIAQEGKVVKANIFDSVNNSFFPNCFANNADAQYVVANVPPPPDTNNNLPPIEGSGPTSRFRLRPDEAVIMLGKTPPPCKYYSMTPYIYERYFEKDLRFHEVFNSLHDPKNNMVIKTDGGKNPFSAFTVIVFTPDKGTWDRILPCLIEAGYKKNIINRSRIPSQILRMGLEFENDVLMCLMRFYGPVEKEGFKEYFENIENEMNVFRVSPNPPIPKNKLQPLAMPKLRIRGTGKTEMELMPLMEKLTKSILDKYEGKGWKSMTYTTDLWLEEGLQGLQAKKNMVGENRDVAYMRTPSFKMYDNEFMVIFGINHTVTGKAAYCSAAVYGTEYINGVGGSNNMPYNNWTGTANEYLPEETEADKFFVLTACRGNPKKDERGNVIEPSHPLADPTIQVPTAIDTHGIQRFKPMFVGFRNYLEEETMSGPIPVEMISPVVIKFSKPAWPTIEPF